MSSTSVPTKTRPSIRLFLTGFTMGIADLVPGVSGGTIAFLFGIYDELLYSIKLMSGQVPRLLLKGEFKKAYLLTPFGFLLPVAIGMLVAIFGFVQIVSYLLNNYPVYVWSLFFGLVLGSAVIVSKRVKPWTTSRALLLMAGFLVTFLLLGLPILNANDSLLALFATGFVAIIAMILPGISGSLIMVILGQYQTVIEAVAERNVTQLLSFTVGAILGLAIFARLLSWLLHNHHAATIAVIVGVLLGSLRRVWPWQEELDSGLFANSLPNLNLALAISILLIALGFWLVWQLDRIGYTKEHVDIDDDVFRREERTQRD